MGKVRSLPIIVLTTALSASINVNAEDRPVARWYRIATESGVAVGYASEQTVIWDHGRQIIAEQEIDAGEEHVPRLLTPWENVSQPMTITRRVIRTEEPAGKTLSISAELRIGREWRRDVVHIRPASAEVVHQTAFDTRIGDVPLHEGVRFDDGDGLLRGRDNKVMKNLEFQNFNLASLSIDDVTIEPASSFPVNASGMITLLRRCYQDGKLVEIEWLALDAQGEIRKIIQPTFGSHITFEETDKDTALRRHSIYRALPNVMTKSLYRISQTAMHGHIRYGFAFRDGLAFEIPQTGEQAVHQDNGTATLDICEGCGPGLPTDLQYLADARKPTAWLQSDRPPLKKVADPIAKLAVSDSKKMEMLLQEARPYLGNVDFTGHFSALETMSRRSGDCTEAAVLLAALGRAAGIPTRVANGLVYSRESYHGISNAWMPHSWTLAWVDGHWRSFDLALDKFDSTHIALTIGDGDERSLLTASQLAGLLRWDSMAEIRTAAPAGAGTSP